MPQFKSGFAFVNFLTSVRDQYRFVHTPEVDEFLLTLVETAEARLKLIHADSIFWRAQLGSVFEQRVSTHQNVRDFFLSPLPAERMMPLAGSAREGRINPKGIARLYLATDQQTAMSEVRPWLGADVSVAAFHTRRDLRVVNCSIHHNVNCNEVDFLYHGRSTEEIADGVWAQVDGAFSRPINDQPETAEYVPTQVIAEAFRQKGIDGVIYKSRLGPGSNLALFDINSARVSQRILFKATSIEYRFEEGPQL